MIELYSVMKYRDSIGAEGIIGLDIKRRQNSIISYFPLKSYCSPSEMILFCNEMIRFWRRFISGPMTPSAPVESRYFVTD